MTYFLLIVIAALFFWIAKLKTDIEILKINKNEQEILKDNY